MPLPRHSAVLPGVQVPAPADLSGVTEIRVHGVGGTPPDVTLGDMTPEQVAGDSIAGFYRTTDRAGRHVEAYSWGGLTSRSTTRVLWLVLLPFLFSNLAGWMCSAATRKSRSRFALHRFGYGLGALALTVNATLIAAMISVDVSGYQALRTGRAARQWWLAPLRWHFVAGHPSRQLAVATVPVVLLVLALAYLARRSVRYEATRPPYRGTAEPPPPSVPAAALPGGLADTDFWDGQVSVVALLRLHFAAAAALLAVVLSVAARAIAPLRGGAPGAGADLVWTILYWAGLAGGLAVFGLIVLFVALDVAGLLAGKIRRTAPLVLLGVAGAVLICAGVFAWLRPFPVPAAALPRDLPGMSAVTGATALGIAVVLGVALLSALAGGFRRGTLPGGPWVTLMIGFGLLNFLMLSLLIWVAHLIGPVSSTGGPGTLYLPALITSGTPLIGWAYIIAVVIFVLVQGIRMRSARALPAEAEAGYQRRAAAFIAAQPAQRRIWYQTGGSGWQRRIARREFLARAPHSGGLLLYGIVLLQILLVLGVWRLHWQAPAVIRYAGTALGGLLVPSLMGTLRAAWKDQVKRKQIAIAWDVGTFWPRSYHPLSPPCYTERAIPDLQRRMWWLHDNGGHVVLAAHSQGSMLAVAALAQSDRRPERLDVALATFGAPVIKLYGWGFPAYVDQNLLMPLGPGGAGQIAGWSNFWYPTDPIAAPVGVPGVDVPLPDPADCWYVYGQPPPGPGGHSGYWSDLRVWNEIDKMAAEFQN